MVPVVILHLMDENTLEITVQLDGKIGQQTGQPNMKEKDSPDDFYGFMYDTNNDASISGKSSDHFGWGWPEMDSLVIEVDWQDDPFHDNIEDLFGWVLRSASSKVAEEVMEMANDQAEALSDQEVADDCLDDEHVEERRPSKMIKVTQEEMFKE
ncbi:hypothetical protein Tco_0146260 [Tanacetum coccineum]